VAIAAAITTAGLALAENSPYYVGVAQSFGHESNLLRLNNGAPIPNGYSKADTVSSTSLLAGIDQPFGRQRLRGDLALRANRYSENDIFNNQSYSANLALDWATVNRLSGTLSGSANRSLASFNRQEQLEFLREKNFEDTQTLDATVRLGVVTQYSLLAGFNHREVRNSLQTVNVQARNFKQDTGSLGLRWQPSSLLTLGVGVRATKGSYPEFSSQGNSVAADEFTRNDIDFTADYRPSGQSTLAARISTGKTEYDRATRRNFEGLTGALTWGWQATGKLRFNTSLTRDTGQESKLADGVPNSTGTADYSRINTALRVGADWAATSKIAVNASLSSGQRDLVSSLPTNGVIGDDSGREKTTILSLGARWAPTRSSLVGCNVNTDRISGSSSNSAVLPVRNLKGSGINCYGQITLQ
jgi:hypothetical protein